MTVDYSVNIVFWWYFEWPEEVRKHTLMSICSKAHDQLVSINVLEYAGILIKYASATHFYCQFLDASDPFHKVLSVSDNTAVESLMLKECNSLWIGRALGRLQCVMIIGNEVDINTARVLTYVNGRADKISHIKRETNSMSHFLRIIQKYPELNGCRRFQPSTKLISHIIDVMSPENLVDPVAVSRILRSNPGQVIS